MEALRAEVGELRAHLAQAAPRRAMVEMDRAITLLHHRVEDMRETGLGGGREEMAYLAEELLELRTALDGVRAPERFEALAAGVEMLSRKIDMLNARAVDPVEVARLQAQSAELKSLVMRTVSGAGLQPLADRLAACAEEITRSSSEAACRMAEATSTFERNAEALIARVGACEASIREGQGAETQELRQDVEAGVRSIHERLDEVSKYLSALPPAVGEELAERLAPLLDRAQAARGADAGRGGPLAEVVESHLLTLTERFQDAHARLERLDGIEALLTNVIEEMRQGRSVSADATQEAVEVAVEAVSRKVSTDADGPAVVGLKRGLAALEARQDEVERRASEILGENLARSLEDRTVVLDRTEDDVWAPQPPLVDEAPPSDEQFYAEASYGEAAPAYAHDMGDELVAEPVAGEAVGEALAADVTPAPEEPEPTYSARSEAYPEFHAESRFEPEPEPVAAASASETSWSSFFASTPYPTSPDLGNVRPDPVLPPRVKKVRRGRSTADVQFPAHSKGQDVRPRVDRNSLRAKRSPGARLSPAVMAVAALAVLGAASAGAAWTHRDAIMARISQATERMNDAPATVAAETTKAEVTSTAALPAPIGPQSLRTAALEGNLAAAYEEGVRFADGVGVPQDIDAGIKWLGYAVSRGYAPAGYRLGSLYENGLHNMDEAYRFYKWAAEQGNVRAMHNLGVLYSQGIDGKPDWGEALKWFREAASLGLKDSQHNLGIIFARGFSGTSDLTEALTWFNIAARQGDQDSADKRDALVREADQATLARARKAADAFAAKPLNEPANVVATLPEWNASEVGEQVGANTLASNDMLFSSNLMANKR